MKCRVCREPAVIDVRRHNANFCTDHFVEHCRRQVERAIHDHDMLEPESRVLVAVSGGKDSLALWELLLALGHEVDGLYLGLGIGEYSDRSRALTEAFAAERGLTLRVIDLVEDHGFDIPAGARAAKRAPCSACGLSKRHLFDEAARDGDYDAIATGHNLDDEAAVLFGNVLHWQTEYLGRQAPVLPARNGFPRKVKPLGAPRRARDRGVLRDPWHRLHRRRVPDVGRQSAPRATRRRSTPSRRRRPARRRPSTTGSSTVRSTGSSPKPISAPIVSARAIGAGRRRPTTRCAFCVLVERATHRLGCRQVVALTEKPIR